MVIGLLYTSAGICGAKTAKKRAEAADSGVEEWRGIGLSQRERSSSCRTVDSIRHDAVAADVRRRNSVFLRKSASSRRLRSSILFALADQFEIKADVRAFRTDLVDLDGQDVTAVHEE